MTELAHSVRTRVAKAAADTGFDLLPPEVGSWLTFASSHAPLRVWITAYGDGLFVVALSQPTVMRAIAEHGVQITSPLPAGSCGARGVTDLVQLHRLLRRAFLLSRTLPDELLKVFQTETASLPRETEAERLVVQRVGQDVFRRGLLDYWEGRCALTGLAVPQLLRASHIKPWADCETDAERLDVFNGLLLAPQIDAVFDAGLITFREDGAVILSAALDDPARAALGLHEALRLRDIAPSHGIYLE